MKEELRNTKGILGEDISETNKKTSSEFNYTNKFFMSHLAGIEVRLMAEHQKLENITVEVNI